jgi:tetratricopeptide (TPR) repeat protein
MLRFFIICATFSLAIICGRAYGADRVAADAYLAGVPTLIASGDYKAVEDLCKRSLAADDSFPSAHYYMAIALEKSNKPRDAFKEYQTATTLAAKEKDNVIGGKASAAAKKLGQGLMEIDALDQKLADKLQKIAAEAIELGRLETARQALTSLLILQPDNAKVKEGLEKVNKAIQDRGDPVRTKIAAAMLTEMWFKLGTGKRDDAIAMARTLSTKFSDTEWGKEATGLLERDFSAPKKEEVAQLSQQIKEQNAKLASAQKTPTPTAVATVPSKTSGGSDIGSLERAADEEAKKMHKDVLVSAFTDAYQKGKAFYANATPGAEGNQENLWKALEQFIRAESFYGRIETEDLKTDELAQSAQEAAMLRYACMKMKVLTH